MGTASMKNDSTKAASSEAPSRDNPKPASNPSSDRHETRTIKVQDSSYRSIDPTFEDDRTYHFNATMPPQTRLPIPVSQTAAGKYSMNLARRGMANIRSSQGSVPPSDRASANLTVEGKRQVYLAAFLLQLDTH